MDMEEASLSVRNVAKGGWFVVFICFLIMSLAGGTCIFGIYSEAIKIVLGYDQETVATLGFFKDLGGNVGIVSGLISEVTSPWVVLGIGAIMKITGYIMIMICLSKTQWIARPKTWQMYLYICIGANSQTFANTGALVTCVKNFPESRGSLLGILKGFVGLSGAIFTQIYNAIYGQDNTGVILLLCILPADVFVVVMFIVRLTEVVADKELKRFFNFLCIALILAGLLMIIIVVEIIVKNFPQLGYEIVAALSILFLKFNIALIANAEMDNMKLQRLSSQSRNGSQKPVHIDPREDEVKIKTEENPKTEINLAKFISDPVASQEGKRSEQPRSLTSCLFKMLKSPTRGDDYSIPQVLVSASMIILFVATTCGLGTTLTAINNMGQIGKALGYTPVNISTFVSLISIWNFLALVMAGCLSEFLMQKHKFPKPLMFTIELLIACVEHVFTAFALLGSLYVASIVIGLCFGVQWPKSLRSCLVSGFQYFTNRKWRERENKGEGQNKVLNYLPRACGYMDVKEASLLAKRRLFVVFICFLIVSPAEGTFMRGIYPKTQSAQTISDSDINQYVPAVHSSCGASEIVAHSGHTAVDVSNVEKYDAVGDGKHDYTQRSAAMMKDMVPRPRKLSEPNKPPPDRGRGAQHN